MKYTSKKTGSEVKFGFLIIPIYVESYGWKSKSWKHVWTNQTKQKSSSQDALAVRWSNSLPFSPGKCMFLFFFSNFTTSSQGSDKIKSISCSYQYLKVFSYLPKKNLKIFLRLKVWDPYDNTVKVIFCCRAGTKYKQPRKKNYQRQQKSCYWSISSPSSRIKIFNIQSAIYMPHFSDFCSVISLEIVLPVPFPSQLYTELCWSVTLNPNKILLHVCTCPLCLICISIFEISVDTHQPTFKVGKLSCSLLPS